MTYSNGCLLLSELYRLYRVYPRLLNLTTHVVCRYFVLLCDVFIRSLVTTRLEQNLSYTPYTRTTVPSETMQGDWQNSIKSLTHSSLHANDIHYYGDEHELSRAH